MNEPVHSGRSWHGTRLEDECPCPKELCGLVDLRRAATGCKEHNPRRGKTMRQAHYASRCPGAGSDAA
jgi:hypothetical protein